MNKTGNSKKSLSHTKNTNLNLSTANYRSFISLSDVNKQLRREQTYKKKFKSLLEINALAQAKIKIFQSSIKEERGTIVFQLNELSKTMNNKISSFVEEKISREQLATNQMARQTIKNMIGQFEQVQRQIKANRKVYQNLNSIYQYYQSYSEEIEKLVQMTKKSNKQYQDSIKNLLQQKQSQIRNKNSHNEDLYDQTQQLIKKIEEYDIGKVNLIQEQIQLQKYHEKLVQIQKQTKNQVKKFNSWAKIVIDKNHRKIFHKQNKFKQNQLIKIAHKNDSLEVYFHQLEIQENKLTQQLIEKENSIKTHKATSKNQNKYKKSEEKL